MTPEDGEAASQRSFAKAVEDLALQRHAETGEHQVPAQHEMEALARLLRLAKRYAITAWWMRGSPIVASVSSTATAVSAAVVDVAALSRSARNVVQRQYAEELILEADQEKPADLDNIQAELKNGVLTIKVRRSAESRPKKVELKRGQPSAKA